jgi:hypothetical protein
VLMSRASDGWDKNLQVPRVVWGTYLRVLPQLPTANWRLETLCVKGRQEDKVSMPLATFILNFVHEHA